MKLYIVERIGDTGYDEFDSFVIRAASAKHARRLASKESYNEPWCLDPKKSSCVVLKEDGEAGVILGSFNAG